MWMLFWRTCTSELGLLLQSCWLLCSICYLIFVVRSVKSALEPTMRSKELPVSKERPNEMVVRNRAAV